MTNVVQTMQDATSGDRGGKTDPWSEAVDRPIRAPGVNFMTGDSRGPPAGRMLTVRSISLLGGESAALARHVSARRFGRHRSKVVHVDARASAHVGDGPGGTHGQA